MLSNIVKMLRMLTNSKYKQKLFMLWGLYRYMLFCADEKQSSILHMNYHRTSEGEMRVNLSDEESDDETSSDDEEDDDEEEQKSQSMCVPSITVSSAHIFVATLLRPMA